MKNNTSKKIKQLTATALIAVTACSTAFAGSWQSDTLGWHYLQDNGTYAAGSWIYDGTDYYYLDAYGNMQTGWLNLNGFWYFLDTRESGPMGSMKTGWQWIDGYCYYFDPLLGGAMAANTTTADGYLLDADGHWMSAAGTPYYMAGTGIITTSTTGTAYANSGVTVSLGGGTGGGGGSSAHSSDASRFSDDDSVSYSANDFTNGNYSKMTSSQIKAMDKAIDEFKDEYITSDMSDFEKEITIIQWICENCDYKVGSGWNNATAYSCIVNGLAQCSGYADAFLQMGKACGLTVRYVYNSTHAWNLIKLDGD